MTETDTTESVDVDLDATVPCESLTGCGELAEWHSRLDPCGHGAIVLCSRHRVELQKFFDAPGLNVCAICDTLVARIAWRPRSDRSTHGGLMNTDIERVIALRRDGGGFNDPRWVKSVTITDTGIWVNGRLISNDYFIAVGSGAEPDIQWLDEAPDGFKVGVLWVPFYVTNDDTIITDLRTDDLGADS